MQDQRTERCAHPDVRCSEHRGRRTIACFTCGRLFCNLGEDDYAVAYNPPPVRVSWPAALTEQEMR